MNHARREKVGKYPVESHHKSCSQILYYDQDHNRDGCEREQNWYGKLAPEIHKNLEVVKPEVEFDRTILYPFVFVLFLNYKYSSVKDVSLS